MAAWLGLRTLGDGVIGGLVGRPSSVLSSLRANAGVRPQTLQYNMKVVRIQLETKQSDGWC